jgi:hypothetical protein
MVVYCSAGNLHIIISSLYSIGHQGPENLRLRSADISVAMPGEECARVGPRGGHIQSQEPNHTKDLTS